MRGERRRENFVVFTHRTSICRWSYSECLMILTKNAAADEDVCSESSSMGRQGNFLFHLVIASHCTVTTGKQF